MIGSIKIFAAIVLVAFVGSIFAFVLTLYLQRIPGFSPLMTGLAFLPSGLGGVFGGQLANRAARCLGVRRAALLGLGLIIVGAIVLTRIEAAGGAVRVITGYLIASVGVVCTLVLMSTTAMASLQADLQGLAAGLLTTFQQVGAALGTSLASVVASTVARAIGGAQLWPPRQGTRRRCTWLWRSQCWQAHSGCCIFSPLFQVCIVDMVTSRASIADPWLLSSIIGRTMPQSCPLPRVVPIDDEPHVLAPGEVQQLARGGSRGCVIHIKRTGWTRRGIGLILLSNDINGQQDRSRLREAHQRRLVPWNVSARLNEFDARQ